MTVQTQWGVTGAWYTLLMGSPTHNQRVGALGEQIAESVLVRHGRTTLRRNVRHDIGEVDLVVGWQNQRVVVEVKTLVGPRNPFARIDVKKAIRLRAMARIHGAESVEVIAVSLSGEYVEVRWIPLRANPKY